MGFPLWLLIWKELSVVLWIEFVVFLAIFLEQRLIVW